MQKEILKQEAVQSSPSSQAFMGKDQIRTIAVTSEDPSCPIENLFAPRENGGWRAGEPGPQQIRITFLQPQRLSVIELEFREPTFERTQEFVIRWAKSPEAERQEIVRQRWNFSPQGSTREREQYALNLDGVLVLELFINPDVSRPDAIASLAHLNIA